MGAGRLLLIEDDAITREVLELLLATDGWNVLAVASGEDAIDSVGSVESQEALPEVILADLHLPGIEGAELAAGLHTLAPHATLLAISASHSPGCDAGYQALLRKPFDAAELRKTLAAVAAQDRAEQPSAVQEAAGEAHGESELLVLSPATLLNLEAQMGVRARDLYAFALADAGDRLCRMERSLAAGDRTAFKAEAHAVKGSAGMIGAERLAAEAAAGEKAAAAVSTEYLGKKVQEMHRACDEIRLMLETLFPI